MPILANYREAIAALKQGQIILFQTDMDWSLGCDPNNQTAVDKLLSLVEDTLPTLLISDITQLNQYVQGIPEIAWDIVEFAENPLTVIYSQGKSIAPSLINNDGIAIRLLRETWPKDLVYNFGRAIVSMNVADKTILLDEDTKALADGILTGPNSYKLLNHHKLSILKLDKNGHIQFLKKGISS
jgi:L-threonylcarbamoyladenylate synthase